MSVNTKETAFQCACTKLSALNETSNDKWIIFHPGVSEKKKKISHTYVNRAWRIIRKKLKKKIIITGSSSEKQLAEIIQKGIGEEAYTSAGLFSIEEFISVINAARLVVSVNTATVHIAAATQTPVMVLYALTNPQRTPWKVLSKVFPFPVNEKLKSRNEIINYMNEHFFNKVVTMPLPKNIFYAIVEILQKDVKPKHHRAATGILLYDSEVVDSGELKHKTIFAL